MAIVSQPELHVVVYHYVRDLPRSRFPRIEGLHIDDFLVQLQTINQRYEIVTLATAAEFLAGQYKPRRDLCLLTFDDGLREHYEVVTPILAERGWEGLFFISTSCPQGRVASVHKNHFLMAGLHFDQYRSAMFDAIEFHDPDAVLHLDHSLAQQIYRWDTPEAALLKYLTNFHLSDAIRTRILDDLFAEWLGDEREFATELYLSWEEARAMQAAGMVLGGHSHAHKALAKMSEAEQHEDLETATRLLHERLNPQPLWPFSYPYGTPGEAFSPATAQIIRNLGYCCAFSTEVGGIEVGDDLMSLRRFDTNDLPLRDHSPVPHSPAGGLDQLARSRAR
jgi:peptidoglycan/xylan/chitin deacetylase (PgdA/CDA1 family)